MPAKGPDAGHLPPTLVMAEADDAAHELERSGLRLYLLNTLIGAVLGIFSKLAAHDGIPFFELVLARSATLVLLTIPLLARAHINPFGHHDKGWLLLLRGVFGFASIFAWYWSLSLLPMSDVNALGFLSPIMVALAAPYVLGEPTPRGIFDAMPFSMLGVLFVAQPSWLFGAKSQTSALGVGVALANPMPDIVFSFGAVSLVGSAAMCASMPRALALPSEPQTWMYVAAACALGYIVQVIFTSALQKARAAPAAACDYLSMIYTLLGDWLVFLKLPSGLSLIGAGIILGASVIPLLWRGGPSGGSGPAPAKLAAAAAAGGHRSGESEAGEKPLKTSTSAEPEVQLAKIGKYLGSGGRPGPWGLLGGLGAGGLRQRASSSLEGEALGLVAVASRGSSSGWERGTLEEAAGGAGALAPVADGQGARWVIPAGRSSDGTSGSERAGEEADAPPPGAVQLHAVLLGQPVDRTSSEKETALLLAGK